MVIQQKIASLAFDGSSEVGAVSAIRAEGAGPIHVPHGNFLLSARFTRAGDDLVLTGRDGTKLLVLDYFGHGVPPALVTEFGAEIAGDLAERLAGPVAPGAFAQAGGAAPRPAIGAVEALTGDAMAMRLDGTRAPLAVGAPVFQGDVVETTPGSRLAIVFVDKTSFTLDSATRMVLDELVFDPGAGGRSAFSLVQGTFVYISGEVAKLAPQNVQIRTPVATVGIRGTEIGFVVLGPGDAGGASFTVLDGQIAVQNSGGTQILGAGFVTNVVSSLAPPAQPIAAPPGNIASQYGALRGYGANAITNSIIRLQRDQQQQLLPPPAPGRGEGPVTGGMRAASGESGGNSDQPQAQSAEQQGLAGIAPAAGPVGPGQGVGPSVAGGSIFGPSAAIKGPLALTSTAIVLGATGFALSNQIGGSDHGRTGGAGGDHRVTQMTEAASPPAAGPAATMAVPDQSVTVANGGSTQIDVLTNDTKPAGVASLTIVSVDTSGTQGTVTINPGGMAVTYVPSPSSQSLGAGETASDTFSYTIVDDAGTQSTATVTVVINGINDAPTAVADAATVAAGTTATIAALANDTDPDSNDTKTIFAVNAGGALGSVSIAAGGAALLYTAGAAFQALADGQTATDTFTYTMVDSGGVQSTASVTVTVTGVNDAPTITSNGGGDTVALSFLEGNTLITTIAAADPDASSTLTYSLAGADAGAFVIDGTGKLSFATAPSFDSPTDAGGDNTYDVTVVVSDGVLSDTQSFAIAVIDDTSLDPNDFDSLGLPGSQTLSGGAGNDLLYGGADGDSIGGDAGQDTFYGGSGNDTLLGGDGAGDLIYGGSGNDLIIGGSGADTLIGGVGDDSIVGGEAGDDLAGSDGDDTISGGNGSDFLMGGAGNDSLTGGSGLDILQAGPGTDVMTGGTGADDFFFDAPSDGAQVATDISLEAAGVAADVITDFVSGLDRIILNGANFDPDADFVVISGEYQGSLAGGSTTPTLILDGQGNLSYDADPSEPGYTVVANVGEGTTLVASDVQFTSSGI